MSSAEGLLTLNTHWGLSRLLFLGCPLCSVSGPFQVGWLLNLAVPYEGWM